MTRLPYLVDLISTYEDCDHFMTNQLLLKFDYQTPTLNRVRELMTYFDYYYRNPFLKITPSKKTLKMLEDMMKEEGLNNDRTSRFYENCVLVLNPPKNIDK